MDIMIVDDDEEDTELFREAVRTVDPNLVCAVAHSGIEALQNLERYKRLPQYIFLDINMPTMDGRETLNNIKAVPKYKGINVIMYSTTRNQKEIDFFTSQGIEFISKPSTYSDLINIIRTRFRQSSSL